jgi:hypothetical protein
VKISVEDFGKTARLHVFATHFLPTQPQAVFMALAKKIAESGGTAKTVFPFAQWKNILLSNRELSDEFRYVFDRKYAERYLGNTLDRPKLLVKRHFVQTTQVSEEVMKSGSQYANQHVQQEVQRSQMVQPMMQQQQRMAPMAYSQNVAPRAYQMSNNIQMQSY